MLLNCDIIIESWLYLSISPVAPGQFLLKEAYKQSLLLFMQQGFIFSQKKSFVKYDQLYLMSERPEYTIRV